MYEISKKFQFSASHQLKGLPEDHPCSRHHGHNYTVEIVIKRADLNEVGFIIDYRDLDRFKKWVDDTLDHRHLNDVVDYNPTAENLAKDMYEVFWEGHEHLLDVHTNIAVKVYETDKTCAVYYA